MLPNKVTVCFLVVFWCQGLAKGLSIAEGNREVPSRQIDAVSNQRWLANEPESSYRSLNSTVTNREQVTEPRDQVDGSSRVSGEVSPNKETDHERDESVPSSRSIVEGTKVEASRKRRQQVSGVFPSDRKRRTNRALAEGAESLQPEVTNKDSEKVEDGSRSPRRDSTLVENVETDRNVGSLPKPEALGRGLSSREVTSESRLAKILMARETLHQQTTNMRPARTQHLVHRKRSSNERSAGEGLGAYGRRYAFRSRDVKGEGGPRVSPLSERGSLSRLEVIQPIVSSASNDERNQRLTEQLTEQLSQQLRPQSFNLGSTDLSRALYQFGPAQLHALRGVFDKPVAAAPTKNFQPIAPNEVAYVPPRIIYETKILPAPFQHFRTEQKTVDQLSALIGQSPSQQLQGLNLILNEKEGSQVSSRQDEVDPVALSQFVTPIPSIDVNSGLLDNAPSFDNKKQSEETNFATPPPSPPHLFPSNHASTPEPSLPSSPQPPRVFQERIPVVEPVEENSHAEDARSDYERVNNDKGKTTHSIEIEFRRPKDNFETTRYRDTEDNDQSSRYAARYKFGYHVRDYESGNNFSHQEERNGVITDGRYHVLLPDGRIQNVDYHVDEGGYHAKVSYHLKPAQR